MDFVELDRELSRVLNLQEGSVFVLKPQKRDSLLEFIYPDGFKGFTMPLINQSILGKAVTHKTPRILQRFQNQNEVIYLNSLTMEDMESSIRKMIVYPICLARQVCALLLLVRKDHDGSDFQDFVEEDLQKVKSAVDKMLYLQLVKSA